MSEIVGEAKMREDFWNLHLDEIEKSGRTQQAYCDEHDLKLATLNYWSKKLGRRKTRSSNAEASKPSFLDLGTTTAIESNFDYEIVMGIRSLKFGHGFAVDEIKKLVEILSC